MSTIKQLSDAQLKAELKRRNHAKKEERKAYKELVKQELPKNIDVLLHASEKLAEAKTEVFINLLSLVKMKIDVFGVKSNQQSHTFSLPNGDSITIGYRVIDNWDDTVNEGVSKVNEFISSLAKDEDTGKLVDAVNRLLKKDAKGQLKANRVVELRNLADEFDNALFSDGVDIITKSYKPVRSVYFIDASIVDQTGAKNNIPLSISSVNFTKELNINF